MNYTVTAERGKSGRWIYQCVEYPGALSESRRLAEAKDLMREAIAFAAHVSEASVNIDLVFPGLDREVVDLVDTAWVKRQQADDLTRDASRTLADAARRLVVDLGLPLRDAGVLLGVSHQRISQIIALND